jgi:protein O-GlcNAc transferase
MFNWPDNDSIQTTNAKTTGRNDPCPCGSGKKYKQCCGQLGGGQPAKSRATDEEIANAMQAAINHLQAGQPAHAKAIFQQVLQAVPDHPDALHLTGLIAFREGKSDVAIELINHALRIKPNYAAACVSLGIALQSQGRLDEAIESFRRALRLEPNHAEVHGNLGDALKNQGKLDEAVESYRQALAIDSALPEVHHNLGNVFVTQRKLEEAIASFREAIRLKPDYAEAFYSCGNALYELGRQDEAIASYRQALALEPDHADARWAIAISQIPPVLPLNADMQRVRMNFLTEIDALDKWYTPSRISEGPIGIRHKPPFYLAYQEADNKPLLSRYGALCGRLMKHWQKLQGYSCGAVSTEGRIRIGIVSNNIFDHSVWTALIKGWVLHLDRSKFELHIFYLGTKHDSETALAQSMATAFVQGKPSLPQWIEAILAHRIEVLIYPEIGMDMKTVTLANLRLAPVQMATWGHPETTGLPAMDYYISATGLEPENAENYYTEKLIELPHLGCCYQQSVVAAANPDLRQLGIRTEEPLLLCPGSPFKYSPQHDWVLVEIARRLGRCQMIFFTLESQNGLSGRFRERMTQVFKEAGLNFESYGTFVPWLARPEFYGLLKRSDVFLDTIGFSGFNTAMQAIECGLPIVTREGRFMRGRLASGILKRMNLPELVAADEEEYISLAVKLVRDKEYRGTISMRIEESRHMLFDDLLPIRAFEDFLVGNCRPVTS